MSDHAMDISGSDHTNTKRERVRALLTEMLSKSAWGEKENEHVERMWLGELQTCVVDDDQHEALEKLPKRMCAYEFKPGDIAWNCKVCQVDETCVMCNDCFISSDHDDHEVFFYYTHSGGCCDCGDTEAWSPDGFCTRHKGAQDADPLAFLPQDLLVNARECIGEVMALVLKIIQESRFGSVVTDDDIQIVRDRLDNEPPEKRYSVIVHFNELQTSQEFASALNKAHPAIAVSLDTIFYQMLKIVGETASQKQSMVRTKATKEEALELAEAMHGHGIIASIVSTEYKAKTAVICSLLQWLSSLANLSDGLCRLICEQISVSRAKNEDDSEMEVDGPEVYPVLQSVIMADSFLPKTESDALHSLLMALLADPLFKQAFAIAFTSSYRQLYREFTAGVGTSSSTILAFSVQFFNRASFVRQLVLEYDLLDVLVHSVLETLRKKPKKDFLEIPFDNSWEEVASILHPEKNRELDIWDVFALGIQRSENSKLHDVNLALLENEAAAAGFRVRKRQQLSPFLSLPPETEQTGRFELDVSSPVFACRRYMSGLLDLRYVLQIEGISEYFVSKKNGIDFAKFLLYLSYNQGAGAEARRVGDHVEMESRGWVTTVEFVSTASDVSAWIVSNVFRNLDAHSDPQSPAKLCDLVASVSKPIWDAFYFWLASCGKYFAPPDFQPGDILRPDQIETVVSCHFPLHRALAQMIRTLSDSTHGLDAFYSLLRSSIDDDEQALWTHEAESAIGFWHRVQLIEPVIQAILWDAQVHSGMWVRNGMSVVSHSMNYGEPPYCLRFRDLDLVMLQFGVPLLGMDWMISTIVHRFGVEDWYDSESEDSDTVEFMIAECLTLFSHLATELPPKVVRSDALRSLVPYLRREIVQRLCVGPCAHSDLSKIATEFFLSHENLFTSNFSSAPVLDQILKEVCVASTTASSGESSVSGKFQYRLKPELYAEYNPTFIHLTRKQHEFAHENWFQHRFRSSKLREQQQDDGSPHRTQSSWLDYPMVNMFLPCAAGFRRTRLSILHPHVRRLVYKALRRAASNSQFSLNILSLAIHLFTLQVYVVEEIGYLQTTPVTSDADEEFREEAAELVDSFTAWVIRDQASPGDDATAKPAVFQLLLKLNPWSVSGGSGSATSLDGDQKHEIGRGIDWLLHRLSRISPMCRDMMEQHQVSEQESKEEADRKIAMAKRRKEAQMRAILQMQQRQAAFSEQMKMMANEAENAGADEEEESVEGNGAKESSTEPSGTAVDVDMSDDTPMNTEETLPECAMCHSVDSENSFMCYVGFAQCSPILSRLNGGSPGRFLSTPIDEMHVGEDVPVHVRLCGHSVHHTCWESYHASQFQRAITGGHHRHALNAVDVTKKEFLCPLCKSISNVLIPTTNDMQKLLPPRSADALSNIHSTNADMLRWLDAVKNYNGGKDEGNDAVMTDGGELEQKPTDVLPHDSDNRNVCTWLEDGLSSLCMAIHKVASGAMQKSHPERYTASACSALFHTLLCTFFSTQENDQLKPEHRFLDAMRFLPMMLQQVSRQRTSVNASTSSLRREIAHLLFFGGSDILTDGTIVLENEHPSTQTQTRKQSQWGKLRWPRKPLLLSHLGSILVKGLLLAESEVEAVFISRLLVLARLIQTLLWYAITRKEEFTEHMATDLAESEENIAFFTECFLDNNNSHHMSVDMAADQLAQLLHLVLDKCNGVFPQAYEPILDTKKLLNVVACEVVPMARVTTFLLQSIWKTAPINSDGSSTIVSKPIFITPADAKLVGFVKLSTLLHPSADPALLPIVFRWVERFRGAYSEMSDPHGMLQQWLSGMNMEKPTSLTTKLTFPLVLARDLHTMHSVLSVCCSGSSRTKYLRSLPRAYVKFYSELAKRKCESCNQFPARPAVCLLCGMLLCAANTCPSIHVDKGYPEEGNPGACTVHAKKCGRGSGMFLLVLEGAVLLMYWKLAAYVGSLYVDEYGEEFGERNRELSKGRPLYLNEERRQRLLRLWLRHEIPNEVVKIQNSSERVIRNSHY